MVPSTFLDISPLRLFIRCASSFFASDFALDNISFSGKNILSLSLSLIILDFEDSACSKVKTASNSLTQPDDPQK